MPALPLSHIRHVNCIAICEIPLPSVFYMRQGPGVCGVAPYINNALDENATKIVKHFQLQPHSAKSKKKMKIIYYLEIMFIYLFIRKTSN